PAALLEFDQPAGRVVLEQREAQAVVIATGLARGKATLPQGRLEVVGGGQLQRVVGHEPAVAELEQVRRRRLLPRWGRRAVGRAAGMVVAKGIRSGYHVASSI